MLRKHLDQNLSGRIVEVTSCHGLRHGDEEDGCLCSLIGALVVLEQKKINFCPPPIFSYYLIQGTNKKVMCEEIRVAVLH